MVSEATTLHSKFGSLRWHILVQGEGQQVSAAGPVWLAQFAAGVERSKACSLGSAADTRARSWPARLPRSAGSAVRGAGADRKSVV